MVPEFSHWIDYEQAKLDSCPRTPRTPVFRYLWCCRGDHHSHWFLCTGVGVMEIIVLREITDWDIPNHTYHVIKGKGKLFGYEPANGSGFRQFKMPLTFSRSRRKFKQVDKYSYEYTADEQAFIDEHKKTKLGG